MTIRCFNIDYDASDEELDFLDACKNPIVMPKEVIVEIDDEEDLDTFEKDPDDFLGEYIADQTGWTAYEFEYDVIEE